MGQQGRRLLGPAVVAAGNGGPANEGLGAGVTMAQAARGVWCALRLAKQLCQGWSVPWW